MNEKVGTKKSKTADLDKYVKLFRTHQQMEDVYKTHSGTYPRIVKVEGSGKALFFMGSAHSNDPKHPQWDKIRSCFQEFLEHKNQKKHVFVEGGKRSMLDSLDEMIIKDGDPGLTQFLAKEGGVPYSSPEPNRTEEVDFLLSEGYTAKQIIAYYFARQLEQWIRGGRKSNPDWRAYLTDTIDRYAKIHSWEGEDLSLENVIKIYEEVYGHKLEPENQKLLNSESNPGLVPLVSACSQLRDRALFTAIYEKWSDGCDVFVTYGSGHAIVLEPALKELANGY